MPQRPLKPGETTAPTPPSADATLGFIGHVRTPWKHLSDCPRQGKPDGPDCTVIVDPPWDAALLGVERFDWIEVYLWYHRARRDLLVIDPRHAEGLRGVFALRSPVRPNPIAVNTVRLMGREGNRLRVRGLEALDGTPLIDIKPGSCPFS